MEFTELTEIMKLNGFEFQKLDYLYFHYKDGYPLKNEMDFDNLFFVLESSGFTVKVMSVLNGVEKEFSFSSSMDNWWFLRIPEYFRNKLF